jgi:hypothetical protein
VRSRLLTILLHTPIQIGRLMNKTMPQSAKKMIKKQNGKN